MGPPDRLTFDYVKGLVFGITFDTFPYELFVCVFLGPVVITIGLGKDYTQQ